MDTSVIVGSPSTPKGKARSSPVPGTTPSDMEVGIPANTSHQTILKDVVAYVEVRSGNDNRSGCIVKELTQLGAEVVPKFTQEVTHVIFKDGKKSTLDKAKKKGVHLVSVLWVDSCKQTQSRVAENLHEPALSETMKTPILLGRHMKKMKSMQPKDFDEEVASSAERGKNRRRRQANMEKWKILETPYSPHLPRIVYAAETQPRSPFSLDMSFSPSMTVPDTPASMRRKLQELREKRALKEQGSASDVATPLGQDGLSPLQRRLFGSNVSDFSSDVPETPESSNVNPAIAKSPESDTSCSGSDLSDENTSKKGDKKKHKLLTLDVGVLPPEALVLPTKATNRMQTKPMILSPAVDKRKGPRTHSVKRRNSEDHTQSSESVTSQSVSAPQKKVRINEAKLPLTSSEQPEATKPVPGAVLKVKRATRRQSVASSSPSSSLKAAEPPQSLVRKRGRKSMSVVPPSDTSSNQAASGIQTILERVSTPSDIATTDDNKLENKSLSPGPQVKRRGRKSMGPKRSSGQQIISPLLPGDNVFDETSKHDTVIQKRSTGDVELSATTDGDTSEKPEVAVPVVAKVNRRRSVRIQSIVNQSQGSYDKPSYKSVISKTGKQNKSPLSTPVGEYGSQGKCPADFDSTADDSVLALLPKKKTFKSVGSAVKRNTHRESDEEESPSTKKAISDVKKSIESTNLVRCLSHSRKSLEDFHPSQFLPSAKKSASTGKGPYDFESSGSGTTENAPKIKRKVKKNKTRPTKCSSSSSDESVCKRLKDGPKYTIATTSMHFDEQDMVRTIIKKLGGYRYSSTITDNTTHVICGDARRTLSVLYAISRGSWLLSKEWVLESLESEQWVDEEPYELHDYFPAAQASRLERVAHGSEEYCSTIFTKSGNIFVADQTSPPHHHLVAFIKLNGGKVTLCTRKADVCVGSGIHLDKPTVTEQWVLDSITSHRCLPLDSYQVVPKDSSERAPSPVF